MYQYRLATEADYSGICQLVKSKEELFLFYPNGEFPLTLSQLQHLAKTRKSLTVITDKTHIIGFANLYDHKPNKYIFIGNVIIDSQYRNQGLGKTMISHMLKHISSKYQLPQARISVFNDNTPALLLYADFGFTPYAMEQRKTSWGKRSALIHMKLDL